jgi:hypothetical protein
MVASKESSQLFDDFIFPKIFQTFRMSIQPTKLIITSVALAVICFAGWIMDFSRTAAFGYDSDGEVTTELDIYTSDIDHNEIVSAIEKLRQDGQRTGIFSTMWHFAAKQFQGAVDSVFEFNLIGVKKHITNFIKALGWVLMYHTVYCIIFFIILLAVFSVSGGAVCRIAALQFARGEKPGLTESLLYGIKRFASFFATPLTPVGIFAFIGLFIFALGLAGNIPRAGELIVGLGMPLILFAGVLLAVIVIGAVGGLNLMFPAVAYDGSDCFDAISRSFSYVYAKPWRMVVYTAIAAVYGSICYTFVRIFAFLSLWVAHGLLHLGLWVKTGSNQVNKLEAIWPEPNFRYLLGLTNPVPVNWTESVAAFLIYLFLLVVIGLVVSFIISFYFTANTIIYSLMRKAVDNTAFEDIYMPFGLTETEPTADESPPEEETLPSEPESQQDEDE